MSLVRFRSEAPLCGRSSSGRAPPCQGGGSEFEPRRPLQNSKTSVPARKRQLRRFLFVRRRAARPGAIQQKGGNNVIFGKYINRYYLRHAPTLLLGIAALILVDYMQLIIPELAADHPGAVPDADQRGQQRAGAGGGRAHRVHQTGADAERLPAHDRDHRVHGDRPVFVAHLLFRGGHPGGDRAAQPDVRPQQGPVPGLLPGEQGGQPDEPVHQRPGDHPGVLWRRRADVLRRAVPGAAGFYQDVADGSVPDPDGHDPRLFDVPGGQHRGPDDDPPLGRAAAGLCRPVRLCPGEFFGHRGGQGFRQRDPGADGLPQAEPGKRGDQRHLHPHLHPAEHPGDPVCGVGHLRHPGLRRLSGLHRPVQRRPAGGIHRLLFGHRLAHHGGVHADRKDLPRQGFPQPDHRAAGCAGGRGRPPRRPRSGCPPGRDRVPPPDLPLSGRGV